MLMILLEHSRRCAIYVKCFCIYIFVGTPGLGYPLLLCLGEKSFVVILNYVQRPDLCGPKALFAQQRSRTHPLVGKGPGAPRVPGEAGAQPEQPGDPDLPWKSGPPE